MKEHLTSLIHEVDIIVQSKLTDGALRLYVIPFIKSKCVRVDYGNSGNDGHSSQIIYFDRQLLHQNDLIKLIEDSAALTSAFNQTSEIVIAQTGIHSGQAIVDIYNLLLILTNEKINNQSYNTDIENEILEDFIAYVNKTPITHKIHIWVSTLIMKVPDSFLDYEEKFFIRKPIPADYDLKEQMAIGEQLESDAPSMCSAIVETEVVKFWPELHNWESTCGKIINSLRLFSNNPIIVLRVKTFSNSRFQHSFDFRPSKWPFPTFLLSHFTTERLTKFREFLQYIGPHIGPDTSTILDDGQTPHPFDIAFHWYNVALTNRISTNGKIAALISCLEALYAIENFEAKYRLSQYCAFHLGFYGHNTLMITQDVNDAYQIRSHYYHGGNVRSTPDRKSKSLLNRMFQHCKLSLSLLLPLKGTIDRKELLLLFPKAIINTHSKEELVQKLVSSRLFLY